MVGKRPLPLCSRHVRSQVYRRNETELRKFCNLKSSKYLIPWNNLTTDYINVKIVLPNLSQKLAHGIFLNCNLTQSVEIWQLTSLGPESQQHPQKVKKHTLSLSIEASVSQWFDIKLKKKSLKDMFFRKISGENSEMKFFTANKQKNILHCSFSATNLQNIVVFKVFNSG